MKKIDFNHQSFQGFEIGEDILVDTCILTALASEHDTWHNTVLNLFNTHIFQEDNIVLLFTSPLIVNEVLHLSTKGLENYAKHRAIELTKHDKDNARIFQEEMMKNFLEEEVLKVLDGNTESTLLQIKLSNKLGAADASNASVANLYGTSFLTIDNRLVHNMFSSSKDLPNIKNIYFTTPIFRSY